MIFSYLNKPVVFCDIETTGINNSFNRITEIACIKYQDGYEVDRFHTLINPNQPIPYKIQQLTGITNAMVATAPQFGEVANRVHALLDGAHLCAHNAIFDYSFIKSELSVCGLNLSSNAICTLRLSRLLYPEFSHYNLNALIHRFQLESNSRHRALGDTEVLISLVNQFQVDHPKKLIIKSVEQTGNTFTLPPNLDPQAITLLPNTPGVYTFMGKDNEVLYIGKSINIKTRVQSHFSNAKRNQKSRRLWEEVYKINYEETVSDLGARLLEIHKIKTYKPHYNRTLRRKKQLWVLRLVSSTTYSQFAIERINNIHTDELSSIYAVFKTKQQAADTIKDLVKTHGLCLKLFDLEKTNGACFYYQLGICQGACLAKVEISTYNQSVESALDKYKLLVWPFDKPVEIINKSSNNEFTEKFIIDNWILQTTEITKNNATKALFPSPDRNFDYDVYKVLVKEILDNHL